MTRSTFYAFTAKQSSQREHDDAGRVGEMRRIHARSHGTYGSPCVTAELRRRGRAVNHNGSSG